MPRAANYVRPIYLSLQVLREAGIDRFPVNFKQILRRYHIRLMTYEVFCAYHECDISVCFDLFGKDGESVYLCAYLLAAFAGAHGNPAWLWMLCDCCNGCMALPNLFAMLYLSPTIKQSPPHPA